MQFEPNLRLQQAGERAGYLLSYATFTTALYFILYFTHGALPVWQVALITASITLVAYLVRRWLS